MESTKRPEGVTGFFVSARHNVPRLKRSAQIRAHVKATEFIPEQSDFAVHSDNNLIYIKINSTCCGLNMIVRNKCTVTGAIPCRIHVARLDVIVKSGPQYIRQEGGSA
jgi:hypothetical protein